MFLRLLFSLVFFILCSVSCDLHARAIGNTEAGISDIAVHAPAPYDCYSQKHYKGYTVEAFHLEMRDGNKIAIDLYLPKGMDEGVKIPAIMYQTRYWRRPNFRWPFRMFIKGIPGKNGKMIETLITNGYAFIAVDARGSGASFGSRMHPWTADEINDGADIADWVVAQSWSDGNIGTVGISYSGTTAEFLTTTNHPAVKAAIPMFSLFDVYEDNAFPGGIQCYWFTENWGIANATLDKNKLPIKGFLPKLLIKGVRPVAGKGRKQLLKAATAEHAVNKNVHDGAVRVDARDDAPGSIPIDNIDVFSPHAYVDAVNRSNAAIYSYSGWLDGAYPHAAIKRHLNLTGHANKLILGPWDHGGKMNISPYNPGDAEFDQVAEVIKFFDFHLKGKQNSIGTEAQVHYYTMGEGAWKAAPNWPPPARATTFFLTADRQLSSNDPIDQKAYHEIEVDNSVGTGPHTRWRTLMGKLEQPNAYPDRAERDKQLLVFESEALTRDMEVTGHGEVDIRLQTNAKDLGLFVYLEDVAPDGTVRYVTEGMLRALYRKINEEKIIYNDAIAPRTYLKEDAQPLSPGNTEQMRFDLLPTSFLFRKGHKIRIAIALADKDHFETLASDGEKVKIMCNSIYPSSITLPVIAR